MGGESFRQSLPTSLAISVRDKFLPLSSSRILFENITYAEGGFLGAFSLGFGCRLYFRFVRCNAPLLFLFSAFALSAFCPPGSLLSLGVFPGDPRARSEGSPLELAILR